MTTYFDRREGRERQLPDCNCAGLVWDEVTQRCELPQDLMSVLNGKNRGLGFYSPSFEGDDFYDYDSGYEYIDGGYFGGYDWSYGADGGGWWDNFDPISGDYIGGGGGADDWSWWDNFDPITGDYIGSGDTIFVGQTDAESPLPAVGGYSWQDFINPWDYTPPDVPWNPWGDIFGGDVPTAPSGQPLPGYCPGGTYHPFPIGHPRQDECAPFPTDPNARRQAQQREQQRQQQQSRPGQQQRPQQQQQGQPCPRGQYRNPTTRRCEPIPACPQGTVFSPVNQKCVPKTTAAGSSISQLAKSPWLWILLAGGVLLASSGNDNTSGGRRRR